jgi:hypothetical protein
MFARRQSGDVGDDQHGVVGFRERDGACHLTPRCGMQDGDRLRDVLGEGVAERERQGDSHQRDDLE